MSSNNRGKRTKKENEEKPPVSSISANTKPQPSGPVRHSTLEQNSEHLKNYQLLAQEQELVKNLFNEKMAMEKAMFEMEKEQFFAKYEDEKKRLLAKIEEQNQQRAEHMNTSTTTVIHFQSLLESEQQATKSFKAQICQLEQELQAANGLIAKSKASLDSTIEEFKKKMQELTFEQEYLSGRGKQREEALNKERENNRVLQQTVTKMKHDHDEQVEDLESIIQQNQLAITHLKQLAAKNKTKLQDEQQNTLKLQEASDQAVHAKSLNEEGKAKEIAKLSFDLAESKTLYLQVQHDLLQTSLELKKKTQENKDLSEKYTGLCEKEQTVQSDLTSAKQTIALVQDQLDNVASEKMQQQEQTIANLDNSNKQLQQELQITKQDCLQYQQDLLKYKQLFEAQQRQINSLQEQVSKHQNRGNYAAASGWALKIIEKMEQSEKNPLQKHIQSIVQSSFKILASQFNEVVESLHQSKLSKPKQEVRSKMHQVLLYGMCTCINAKSPLDYQTILVSLVNAVSNNPAITLNETPTMTKLYDLIQVAHNMAECMIKFGLEYQPSESQQNIAFDNAKHSVEQTKKTTTKTCIPSGTIKHVIMPGIFGNDSQTIVKAIVTLRKVNE